jgi:hypothetical protein
LALGASDFSTESSLVASIMLPLILIFPDMNAFWPLSFPDANDTKSRSFTAMTMSAFVLAMD